MSYKHKSRAGFTLVELLVSLVIISILAAMTLSGLSAVRRRSREEATRTTIRKIHEIIVPQYESYLDKRIRTQAMSNEISPSSITNAMRPDCWQGTTSLGRRKFELRKLASIRRTLSLEMPDNWDDVGAPSSAFPDYSNGRTSAYESYENSSTNVLESLPIDSAECLYMICLLSGFQPEAMENFRAEEIGDVDNDQRPEFLDAWGRPIAFIRWPTAFDGPITLNQDTDPFDPESIDLSSTSTSSPRFLTGVVPLIYSSGLDQESGFQPATTTSGQSTLSLVNFDNLTAVGTLHFASPLIGSTSWQDNISNHDLITR